MALEGPQCAGVGLAPSGLAAITTTLLAVLKAGDHLLVCDNAYRPDAQFLQRHAGPLWRRDHLFRSPDRRRHRRIVQAEHPGGAGRGARLAILRNARHSRDRRGRACARRARDRRQHLGDAALSPLARAGRRHQHAGRDQIYRRPFRHHVRNDLGQRQGLAADRRGDPPARRLRRTGRRVSGAARLAHARGAAGAASPIRPRYGALARRRGPRSSGCCIPRSKAIPAMRSGSAISPAPPACSASC